VDETVRCEMLSVNRLAVDKAVDTHTVVDKRRLTALAVDRCRADSNVVM